MIVKDIITTDFINFKVPSMYIAFPHCTFKCEKECGISGLCQNLALVHQKNIEISIARILELYNNAKYAGTAAIVCAGLEPMDSFDDLLGLLKNLRSESDDLFVIYTGYTEEELKEKLEILKQYPNVIVKFGRFRPNEQPHFDETLGINLVSSNQYAKKIS